MQEQSQEMILGWFELIWNLFCNREIGFGELRECVNSLIMQNTTPNKQENHIIMNLILCRLDYECNHQEFKKAQANHKSRLNSHPFFFPSFL